MYPGLVVGMAAGRYTYPPSKLLSSSRGHQSGLYTFYWNPFLFQKEEDKNRNQLELNSLTFSVISRKQNSSKNASWFPGCHTSAKRIETLDVQKCDYNSCGGRESSVRISNPFTDTLRNFPFSINSFEDEKFV